MDGPDGPALRIGTWRVDAISSYISRDGDGDSDGDGSGNSTRTGADTRRGAGTGTDTPTGDCLKVDARLMRLLLCLADRAGKVVTTDELLNEVWSGVIVTPDSVYQAVASLRRLLGDDPKKPTYIATVPRQGYRLVATVSTWRDAPPMSSLPETADTPRRAPRGKISILLAICAVLCLAQAASVGPAVPSQKSIAVLPFLDLTTESMDQEYFADGMTEELIDELSKIPGLKVSSATAAFYFKGKQKTIANIAAELGVAYVVDGSLRKSGSTLRIAARLVRADDGFVAWSETYDRQSDDVLKVQDDVAIEVTRELTGKLIGPDHPGPKSQ